MSFKDAIDIAFSAVSAANGKSAILNSVKREGNFLVINSSLFELPTNGKLLVICAGKAACSMAEGISEVLKSMPFQGIIITKDGNERMVKDFNLYTASHPLPDKRGLLAARRIYRLANGLSEKDALIFCLSGGASALLPLPVKWMPLKLKSNITKLIQENGGDIFDLNTVRKHISKIKGGLLAKAAYPARVLGLLISDVPGDVLDAIGSGPTAPDPSTFLDAYQVLEKLNLLKESPPSVLKHLKKGINGEIEETPKPGDIIFKKVINHILMTNSKALTIAKEKAENLGYKAILVDHLICGEAREAAIHLSEAHLKIVQETDADKICILSGGETTVKVKGTGKGGRNLELALAYSEIMQKKDGWCLVSLGTDGKDGNAEAAGAFVSPQTMQTAQKHNLKPRIFLDENNSFDFFQKVGGLIEHMNTETNVMDIQVFLCFKKKFLQEGQNC